jgi:hypothetical protein
MFGTKYLASKVKMFGQKKKIFLLIFVKIVENWTSFALVLLDLNFYDINNDELLINIWEHNKKENRHW